MMIPKLSRRNLLKLGTAGIVASLMGTRQAYGLSRVAPAARRVGQDPEAYGWALALANGTLIRAEPSLKAKKVKALKKDEVVAILGPSTQETSGSEYNKWWYQVDGGFVHSAGLLEVPNTTGNVALTEAGPNGFWAELTVPYFDVRSGPGLNAGRTKYRYYGSTVYKIKEVARAADVPDASKLLFGAIDEYWYWIEDEQFPARYFVPASYMRIITEDEMDPISPEVAPDQKTVTVDIESQRAFFYEKGKQVFDVRIASGQVFKAGNYTTPKGDWFVYRKTPSQHMWGGAVGNEGSFDLPGIPWVSYFMTTGQAFHGTYWHNDYGRPRSHGCVNTTSEAAKWIFRWTMPYPDSNPKNWYTQAPWRKPDFAKVTKVKVA
jgi:lipoprotein-anchoring transpeptidase ErfK/SrfK